RIAALMSQLEAGAAVDAPGPLKNRPALRAVYNHLERESTHEDGFPTGASAHAAYLGQMRDRLLDLGSKVDCAVREARPDNWGGVKAKENVIMTGLLPLLRDNQEAVERLFPIILAQRDY